MLSPHYTLADYRELWEQWLRSRNQNPSDKAWRRYCEDIAAGTVWNLAFLDRYEHADHSHGVRVIDFHRILTMPRPLLEEHLRTVAKPRPRLRPPYCEFLSQAFARYFMRVGLPQPVTPEWEAKKA